MVVISGAPRTLPQCLYSKVAHYRHKVFIEQLGWQLPTLGEGEQDQFDRSDTVYVVAQDEDGHIFGCARLLPTTRPIFSAKSFPNFSMGYLPHVHLTSGSFPALRQWTSTPGGHRHWASIRRL